MSTSHDQGSGRKAGRVADYFVVVGANSTELRPLREDDPLNANEPRRQRLPLEMVFEAEIISRYPLVDQEHAPSFPDGLTLFCLPDGLRISTRSKPPSFFSFVQTSDKGSRLVGSCLTFYEKLNDVQRNGFLELCKNSPETIAEHPNLEDLRLYIPRCLCIISHWPFVESFRKFLCHIYRISLSPSTVPIERFICNFIDDVPVPPSGKVEVSYLVPGGGAGEDSAFIFKRPPINEPNAWSTLPMKSLFECLSVPNILAVFAAVLVERQVVFISSQNHLMASAAETIISLMYPLQWSHVYIPILPRCLLGVLSAPVPLILGLHSSFLPSADISSGQVNGAFVDERYYAVFSPETVQVYLDENRVEFGSLGLPPPLPERRRRKLYADLIALLGANCFARRPADWITSVQPYYDSAYKMSLRPDMVSGSDEEEGGTEIDEKAIRGSFLKFFVSILQNYRRFLVYPSKANPFPKKRFLENEFVSSSEADWRVFLQPLVASQAFHQFLDLRLSRAGWIDPEIIFFDESIDAKTNRYTFRLHKLDTPFLTDDSNKHTKTYVAPTVDMQGLEDITGLEQELEKPKRKASFIYANGFPALQPHLFVSKNTDAQSTVKLFGVSAENNQRLKKANTLRFPYSRNTHSVEEVDESSSGKGLSPACTFSTFLTLWGSFISTGLSEPKVIRAPPTLSEVLGKLNLNITVNKTNDFGEDGKEISQKRSDATVANGIPKDTEEFSLLSKPILPQKSKSGFLNFSSDLRDEYLTIARSAIIIAFELFHVMVSRRFVVNANVYRTLANACAVCGAGDQAIDLLKVMLAQKMLPDRVICSSIASAISFTIGKTPSAETDVEGAVEDCLLITPKDVYEAAASNNISSLVKHMKDSHPDDERNKFDKLLLENQTRPTSVTKRFSIFSRRSSKDALYSSIQSSGLVVDDKRDDEVLANVEPASPRFCSQLLLAERTLDFIFPALNIDVCNPFGTTCPNFKCKRALSMAELMENYKPFDANAYAVTCPYCEKSFVPRFTVHSTREGWMGSEGPGSLLWCELLSPWVLQKEIMLIIEEYGIQKIVSDDFKTGASNPQYAVLFWNLIVSFRLYGLPYAFFICEKPSIAFLIPLD